MILSMQNKLFQCLSCEKIHHKIPASSLAKMVVDMWQVGMLKACKQLRFAFEGCNGLGQFFRTQAALAHLLDGYWAHGEAQIISAVDSREATSTNLGKDT